MTNLTLVRHGQSDWNNKNLFTGWENPGLTKKGVEEAHKTGNLLKKENKNYSYLFTSILDRAINTADIILEELGIDQINIIRDQALNERDYGELTGLNKDAARKKWGEDQVHIWRRSFDIPPPGGESLKDTAERVIPYFRDKILPLLIEDNNILISAHGNSLRALVMHIEGLSSEEILTREIATGQPISYEFFDGKFNL
ncbi:MAG: 2,3-bisphosphoglycerate-dependent phosphoglycerate mutase [Pseudomonadota bacterium]|nr:2,3-bisphosphoglycerate-dependent phosphoglycerate mutase [Pseudomonadota bacterium]MEC8498128.1 2,3-bisphosphoglycerate-dependent phosphoglycerate mutase [Pseudomonadota bacterium]GIS05559.1 MAG: 2,3-bisphosphoglycerate-dependent phosphoglycerate mutase [Candidatus Dadabacteria bacterium]|tara:strand:+ start:4043 stop:4639 length:597 start_codon:yes stop_codon:yes gene_type:complete